jgi:hypothetical protein
MIWVPLAIAGAKMMMDQQQKNAEREQQQSEAAQAARDRNEELRKKYSQQMLQTKPMQQWVPGPRAQQPQQWDPYWNAGGQIRRGF